MFVHEDRLEIDVPTAREVKLKAPKRAPEIQEKADRRVYRWVQKDIEPEGDNDEDQDEDETGPDVQLTTFTDWKQVAQWYAKLQGERGSVDDGVRKRAADLTKGADTPSEKARRLYDFVARNVRYVSISLGVGRYQPPSDAIAAYRKQLGIAPYEKAASHKNLGMLLAQLGGMWMRARNWKRRCRFLRTIPIQNWRWRRCTSSWGRTRRRRS
jgi:hypothetical protein